MCWLINGLLIGASCLLATPLLSEELTEASNEQHWEDQVRIRLRSIRERVSSQQRLLEKLEEKQATLQAALKKTDSLISQITNKRTEVADSVEKNYQTQNSLELETKDLQEEQDKLLALFRLRLKALYLKNRGLYRVTPSLFQRAAASDHRAVVYGKLVARHDDSTLKTLQQLSMRLISSQQQLVEEQRKNRALLYQYERLEGALSQRQAERHSILEDFERRQEQVGGVIGALKREAIRLEHLVNSITSSELTEDSLERPAKEALSAEIYRGSFEGAGLPQRFRFPLDGIVNRRFGKEAVIGFAGHVMRKGVIIQAAEPGSIRAVADGIARFVGVLPGFNKVVILDHGARYYTLYGRLGEVRLQPGSRVVKDQEIARATETGELYFEVRHNGVPQDPENFLVGKDRSNL